MISFRFLARQARTKDSLLFVITFCIALTALLSELLSIRAAKLGFGIGFEFFIIPLAVLGMGLGGVFISILSKNVSEKTQLFFPTLVYPLVAIAPFALAHYAAARAPLLLFEIAFFFCGFASYFTAGWIVSSILGYRSGSVSALYCFDLSGGACGVLLCIAISNAFGYESAVVALFLFSLIAALLTFEYFYPAKKALLANLLLFFCFLAGFSLLFSSAFSISCPEKTSYDRSNSYTHVEIRGFSHALGAAMFGVPQQTLPASVAVYQIGIDCFSSGTVRLKFPALSDAMFLKDGLRSIPLAFLEQTGAPLDSALVLGSGGGSDVLRARLYGFGRIDAVELNPLVVAAARSFPSDPSDPYADPSVHVVIGDSRQFVASTLDSYRLILDLKSTKYGSSPFAADTNYASTEEAESLYLEHLLPKGFLVEAINPGSLDSVAKKAIDSLAALGIDPADKIAYVKGYDGVEDLLLIRREAFSPTEKTALTETAHVRGFAAPTFFDAEQIRSILALNQYMTISDDRPFVWDFVAQSGTSPSVPKIIGDLEIGAAVALALLLGMVLLPFVRISTRSVGLIPLAYYFAATGVGFITFEIAAIQKFSLIIANPADSIAVVLGAVLLFGGLGSLATMKIVAERGAKALTWSNISLTLWFVAVLFWGHAMSGMLLPLPVFYRIASVLLILAIPGFAMGMFFPIGIKTLRLLAPEFVPWAWGVGGIAGVLGGLGAKIISFEYGVSATLAAAAICYLIAWLCFYGVSLAKRENM
jgi:hypothetical protein